MTKPVKPTFIPCEGCGQPIKKMGLRKRCLACFDIAQREKKNARAKAKRMGNAVTVLKS